jgi:hypothetical protein
MAAGYRGTLGEHLDWSTTGCGRYSLNELICFSEQHGLGNELLKECAA